VIYVFDVCVYRPKLYFALKTIKLESTFYQSDVYRQGT